MSKPKLYMMCGLSGSGKTTFAKSYAEEDHLHYLCPDDFYRLFNGDDRKHINEFEIWMALFRALHMAEQQGIDTIFDTNNPTYVGRIQLLDWFPGFETHLIYIETDKELCRENNRSRRRVIPEQEMDRMIRVFEPPSFDEDDRYHTFSHYRNKNNSGFELVDQIGRGQYAYL